MADNSVTLRIGADPTDLNKGLRQSNAAISTFGARTKATIARVGGSIKGLADRMVTPFNSLVLGGGIGMAVKNVGDLSEALMYYGFAAKKSDGAYLVRGLDAALHLCRGEEFVQQNGPTFICVPVAAGEKKTLTLT